MKKILAIIFLVLVTLFMGFKIYIYYTYKNVYENVLNSDINGQYHTKKAEVINVPVISNIKDYYLTDFGFFTAEIPYNKLSEQKTSNGIILYTFALDDVTIMIRPVDMVYYGDEVYDHELLLKWNKKYNSNLETHKDFYDAMWQKDFAKVDLVTSINTTLAYSEILSHRNVITPSGKVYYFTNDNYSGYIINGKNIVIHLFNRRGNSLCEITLSSQNDDYIISLDTIKNIVGSIKIK